jgi:hypothetical protein
VEYESTDIIFPPVTHAVDIANLVEPDAYGEGTICHEPTIHECLKAYIPSTPICSPPEQPDSGVRSPPEPPDSEVRSPPEPPDSGVCSPPEPPVSGVRSPPDPPDSGHLLGIGLHELFEEIYQEQASERQVTQVSSNNDSIVGVECPCCNEKMTVSHVCFEDSESNDILPPEIPPEPNVGKNCLIESYVPHKVTAPRFTSSGNPTDACETFCFLAGFDTYDKIGHSGILYYKCSECEIFICHVCKKRFSSTFSVLGSPCCQNFQFESTPYDANLLPKYELPYE